MSAALVVVAALLLVGSLCPPCMAAQGPALEGGGLEALPPVKLQHILLENGDFREGAKGWKLSGGAFAVVPSPDQPGKSCLRFDSAAKPPYVPTARLLVHGVRPGIYVLRFRVKLQDLRGMPIGFSNKPGGVRVSLVIQTKEGLSGWPSTEVFTGTADWKRKELVLCIAHELKNDEAGLTVTSIYGSGGRGQAFFDDFTLARWTPPAVEAFLRYPNYRGYLPEDGPQTVRLWIRVNEVAPAHPVRIEVTDTDSGKKVATKEVRLGVKEKVVEIDARQWPLGSYAVVARLGDYRYPAYLVRKISRRQREGMAVWFDENNVAWLDGKAAFPIGFYNAGGFGDFSRLERLKQSPTNFTIDYQAYPLNLAYQRRYMDQLRQHGLPWYLDTLIADYPNTQWHILAQPIGKELLPKSADTQEDMDRFLTRLGQEMRKIPGHGGWYVMDEAGVDRIAPTFHQYCVVRRADPDHPTYGVSTSPDELFNWRDSMDVFGTDPYPLMNMAAGRPLTLAGDWTRESLKATQGSRPMWTVIQFFQGVSRDRWPTAEELRTMSLMSIVEGARGLFYWSFGTRALSWVKDPQQRDEYWRRAVQVTKELKELEPALVAADAPELVTSVSERRVRWRARVAEGKWFVFAYLPAEKFSDRTQKGPIEVTFTLKDGRTVTRQFHRDMADWFQVAAKGD